MWALYAKIVLDAFLTGERAWHGHVDQAVMFAGFTLADAGALWIALRSTV